MPPVGSQLPGRARGEPTISNSPVRVANQFLAGEAVTVERIGHQLARRSIEREGEIARRRGGAAH